MDTKTLNQTAAASSAQPRINYAKAAPSTFAAMRALQAVVNQLPLEKSLLELVKIHASQINGCAFCIDMHVRDWKAAGGTDDRVYLLSAWREVDVYTPRERAALLWTDVLTRLAGQTVSDETFAEVRSEFSEEELAHLTLTIVTINGWNRFNVAFRTPPGFTG